MKAAVLLLVATCILSAHAANYAVIVAGSNGFMNYRHQADVCHAYHVLIDDGNFDAENIILMSYDDVAGDSENPFPGQLFNKPTDGKGTDVYNGCKIDYKGDDVTAENFMNILKGDEKAMKGVGSGKVLKSTSEDKVFLNFADHGGSGLIAFPVGDYLYAKDLISTFDYMTKNNMYKELVFYLEACESGSMFGNLPTNTKIYAVSAANPTESSWGTYCPPDDKVNGKEVGSCLGDTFSINWMEDSDANKSKFNSRTLQEQFATVKKLTTQSEAMQWGDLSFTSEPIGNFLSKSSNSKTGLLSMFRKSRDIEGAKFATQIDSRDIDLQFYVNKFTKNPNVENQKNLVNEINSIKYFDEVFTKIKSTAQLTGKLEVSTNFECYQKMIQKFETQCGKPNNYAMKYFKYLYEICQTASGFGMEGVYSHIDEACP